MIRLILVLLLILPLLGCNELQEKQEQEDLRGEIHDGAKGGADPTMAPGHKHSGKGTEGLSETP